MEGQPVATEDEIAKHWRKSRERAAYIRFMGFALFTAILLIVIGALIILVVNARQDAAIMSLRDQADKINAEAITGQYQDKIAAQYWSLLGEANKKEVVWNRTFNWLLIGAGVGSVIVVGATVWATAVRRMGARRALEDRLNMHFIARDATKHDLQTRLNDSKRDIEAYHSLVQNYARSSRQAALIAIAVGFVFIVMISLISVSSSSTAAAISSSVIGAAGALVTGFIAKAVLANASTSSQEVMAFFSRSMDSQHELSAERIVEAMPDDEKHVAQLMLIEYLTGGPRDSSDTGGRAGDAVPPAG